MSQNDIDGYIDRLQIFLRSRERTIPSGLRNDIFFSGTSEQVVEEIKRGGTSRHNFSPVEPTEEQAKFLNIESMQQLRLHAGIEQLPSRTGGEMVGQNYVVVSMNGVAAVSFFKSVGLYDCNGDSIPGLQLKVMDILVGLIDNTETETDNDLSVQVLQKPTGNRTVSSQRSLLLRSNFRVKGRVDPGNGRAYRRVVEAIDLDSARPHDLAVKRKGWMTNHRQRPTSTVPKKPPFSQDHSNAIGAIGALGTCESDCESTDSDGIPSKHKRHSAVSVADTAEELLEENEVLPAGRPISVTPPGSVVDACAYEIILGSWKQNLPDVNSLPDVNIVSDVT